MYIDAIEFKQNIVVIHTKEFLLAGCCLLNQSKYNHDKQFYAMELKSNEILQLKHMQVVNAC